MKILIVVSKVVIVAVALLGGLTGLWSACTTHDALKFKQPFEEHDQLAKSYMGQITSAEKRNDLNEVTRVRRNYEAFEENWRAGRQIVQIVAPIESLASVQLSAKQITTLKELMAKAEEDPNPAPLSSKTLGAAYLALDDFQASAAQLTVTTSKKNDPDAFALKAAAYSGLASRTTDPDMKQKYEAAAAVSFSAALEASPTKFTSTKLRDFAQANPRLEAILKAKGIELTNP
jgi:FtsZ-interacting cell division protein ZipA